MENEQKKPLESGVTYLNDGEGNIIGMAVVFGGKISAISGDYKLGDKTYAALSFRTAKKQYEVGAVVDNDENIEVDELPRVDLVFDNVKSIDVIMEWLKGIRNRIEDNNTAGDGEQS